MVPDVAGMGGFSGPLVSYVNLFQGSQETDVVNGVPISNNRWLNGKQFPICSTVKVEITFCRCRRARAVMMDAGRERDVDRGGR